MLTTCKLELVKGQLCQIDKSATNDYCHRHQRYFERDTLLEEGKRLCSNFIYGCNIIVKTKFARCEECIKKPDKKTNPCAQKPDCKAMTFGEKYCGKHYRYMYFDEELETGIKYCNVLRGCYKKLNDGFKRCEDCRKECAIKETKLKKNVIEKNEELEKNGSKEKICISCPRLFIPFLTQHKIMSMKCQKCHNYVVKQDEQRINRIRNYREERFRNINQLYKDYNKSAKRRNHSFDLDLEKFKVLALSECHYCDYYKEGEVNGIDRVNNDLGYTMDNCVTCCYTCNKMKRYYHPLYFVQTCKIFTNADKSNKDHYKHWFEYYGKTSNKCFSYYKRVTESRRNIKVNITQEDWDRLTLLPCYLCGYSDKKGIGLDRVDNTKREYTLDNVKPCCSNCNCIKNEFSLETILEKAKSISVKWKDLTMFESVPRTTKIMKKSRGNVIEDTSESDSIDDIYNEEPEIERKSWKAKGVYDDIINGTCEFAESQVDLEEEEYEALEEFIQVSEKEDAITYIKALLILLNKRRNKYIKKLK
jgi:hypothetical protein